MDFKIFTTMRLSIYLLLSIFLLGGSACNRNNVKCPALSDTQMTLDATKKGKEKKKIKKDKNGLLIKKRP